MKFQVTLSSLLVICLVFLHINADRNGSLTRRRRIVDGTIARLGEYPYVAKIMWYWRKPKLRGVTCSATAISKDFVMTAARCYQLIIDDKKKRDDTKFEVDLTQTYGTTQVDLNGNAKLGGFGQKRTGVKLYIHSAYLHVSTMFDVNIALVKVNTPWKIYSAIRLPKMAKPLKEDSFLPCIGVGIGRTKKGDSKKRVNWFKVNVGHVAYCKYLQEQYNRRKVLFDSFYMCTKALSPNQDVCTGDIGGALICDGLFAGVMSQRVQDYECQVGGNQFTLYISVGSHDVFDWVKGYIPDLADPLEITMPDPWNLTTRRP